MKSQENALQLFDKSTELLQEVHLPSFDFDIFEQFSLALQNRDKNAMEFLISDKMVADDFKDKQDFINKYLNHCNKLEGKYGKIYVQTHKGSCGGGYCLKGRPGFAVSVHSVFQNKQLWNFNIITELDDTEKIDMCKCWFFKVNKAEI